MLKDDVSKKKLTTKISIAARKIILDFKELLINPDSVYKEFELQEQDYDSADTIFDFESYVLNLYRKAKQDNIVRDIFSDEGWVTIFYGSKEKVISKLEILEKGDCFGSWGGYGPNGPSVFYCGIGDITIRGDIVYVCCKDMEDTKSIIQIALIDDELVELNSGISPDEINYKEFKYFKQYDMYITQRILHPSWSFQYSLNWIEVYSKGKTICIVYECDNHLYPDYLQLFNTKNTYRSNASSGEKYFFDYVIKTVVYPHV